MSPSTTVGFAGLDAVTAPATIDWLDRSRRDAVAWVADHGYPTRKDEDWKYLHLEKMWTLPFDRGSGVDPAGVGYADPADAADHADTVGGWVDAAFLDAQVADLDGSVLVFIDGAFAASLSHIAETGNGVVIGNLADVLARHPEWVEDHWTSQPAPDHAFQAVNIAWATDGAFIRLDDDVQLTQPVQMVFVSTASSTPTVVNPRSMVLLGKRSSAKIVQTHLSFGEDCSCTNSVVEVVLDEGASLDHYKIQDVAETAFHFAALDVVQGPESTLRSGTFALGGKIARDEIHVRLNGDGAKVDLDGLYLPRDGQQLDQPILIDHCASNCTSRQLYKGVLDGDGHGVFNGQVIVHPGTLGTDADQSNRNLLLSDRAEVDTRPRLMIYADDVKATHGAAVGRLDEEALFYLRSRGISETEAREVLTYAFVEEMVHRVTIDALREWVEEHVSAHLSEAVSVPAAKAAEVRS